MSDLNQEKVNHKTMNSYSGTNIAMGNEPNPVLCSVSTIFKKGRQRGRVNSVITIMELQVKFNGLLKIFFDGFRQILVRLIILEFSSESVIKPTLSS